MSLPASQQQVLDRIEGALAPDPDQPGLGLALRDPDADRYRRS